MLLWLPSCSLGGASSPACAVSAPLQAGSAKKEGAAALDEFCRDLCREAESQRFDPVSPDALLLGLLPGLLLLLAMPCSASLPSVCPCPSRAPCTSPPTRRDPPTCPTPRAANLCR